MTESGRQACPDLSAGFHIMPEIVREFRKVPQAWANFRRLRKLIEASARGEMIGDWHDCGRLLTP